MRSRIRSWKTLPAEHKDFLWIYSWGFLWAVVYYFFAPLATFTILNRTTILLWCSVATIGAVLAVTGLVTRDNLIVERLGVSLLMVAPIVFALTQIAITIVLLADPSLLTPGTSPFDRLHAIVLGFWPFFWLNKRRRQLKIQVVEAKETPLKSENNGVAN